MCSGYGMKVWLGKFFPPGHCCVVQAKGKGERRRARRCEKELYNEQRDHAIYLAAMKVNCVCG